MAHQKYIAQFIRVTVVGSLKRKFAASTNLTNPQMHFPNIPQYLKLVYSFIMCCEELPSWTITKVMCFKVRNKHFVKCDNLLINNLSAFCVVYDYHLIYMYDWMVLWLHFPCWSQLIAIGRQPRWILATQVNACICSCLEKLYHFIARFPPTGK